MKKLLLILFLVGFAAVSQAVMVDDFESYATGEVEAVAQPPWYYEHPGSGLANIDASCINKWITFGDDSGDWRCLYRSANVHGVGVTTTAHLCFKVWVDAETAIDHAFGLSEVDAPTWYSDLGPYVRVTDDTSGTSGVVSLDCRDGGGFVDDIATLNLKQWYTITLDIDTAGGDAGNGGCDIYVDGVLAYSSADFRHAYANPLDTFVLYSGKNTGSQNVRVDAVNITITPEPMTVALLGLGGLAVFRRRK